MKPANRKLVQLGVLAAFTFSSGILSAQPAEGQGGPRKPPPEAIDACKSLRAGQECSFSSPHGMVRGSCWAPEGKPLACKPKDVPNDGTRPMKQ